jgi:hypothetical protein
MVGRSLRREATKGFAESVDFRLSMIELMLQQLCIQNGTSLQLYEDNIIDISACEKDEKWQLATDHLSTMGITSTTAQATVERDTISCNTANSACEKDEQCTGSTMAQAKVERDTTSSAAISACEKGDPQHVSTMARGTVERDTISCNTASSACEKDEHEGHQLHAGIIACEKDGEWQSASGSNQGGEGHQVHAVIRACEKGPQHHDTSYDGKEDHQPQCSDQAGYVQPRGGEDTSPSHVVHHGTNQGG